MPIVYQFNNRIAIQQAAINASYNKVHKSLHELCALKAFTIFIAYNYIIMCVASSAAGIIAGAVILALVCTCLQILIPVCIVCCIGIGICGSSRNRRPTSRVVTTAAPPPTAAVVSTTTTTSSQKVDYPPAYPPAPYTATQPPPPTYAAQPPAPYSTQPPALYPTQPPAPYPAQPPASYPAQDTSAPYPPHPLNESYPSAPPQAPGYPEEPPPYGGYDGSAYPPAPYPQ